MSVGVYNNTPVVSVSLAAVCAHVIVEPVLAVTVKLPLKDVSATPKTKTVMPTDKSGAATVAVTTLVLLDKAVIVLRSMYAHLPVTEIEF